MVTSLLSRTNFVKKGEGEFLRQFSCIDFVKKGEDNITSLLSWIDFVRKGENRFERHCFPAQTL